MLIKDNPHILSHDITPQTIFQNRRNIIKAATGISITSLMPKLVEAQIKNMQQFLLAHIQRH